MNRDVNSAKESDNKKENFYNFVSKILSFVDDVDNSTDKTKIVTKNKTLQRKGDKNDN